MLWRWGVLYPLYFIAEGELFRVVADVQADPAQLALYLRIWPSCSALPLHFTCT